MFIDNVFDNQRMNACLLTEQPFYLEHLGFGHLPSLSEIGCDSLWVHEYVITCLLENAVSWKIKRGGPHPLGYPQPTSFTVMRHVCLGGALARPCTILVPKSPAPELHCCASHQHGSEQGHGGERQSGTCLFRGNERLAWVQGRDSNARLINTTLRGYSRADDR